ncbi:hypothetical protein ACFY5F_07145 [Streptomyces sp. NPDC013161]|uniref:hypothetical protein n=1 Tax=unclassified Streptomyces TaxID=2593676 RepID=UPI0036867AE9
MTGGTSATGAESITGGGPNAPVGAWTDPSGAPPSADSGTACNGNVGADSPTDSGTARNGKVGTTSAPGTATARSR